MKANEFVKMHGLQYTKNIIGQFPKHTHVTNDGRMFIDENTCASHIKFQLNDVLKISDLKRLIESHEWVGLCGGLEDARALAVVHNDDALFESIADVESCMELTK